MKKHLIFILANLLISTLVFAQSADGFKYQAIIRDAAGNVNANASVQMEISILQGAADGTAVFTETHAVVSNTFGLVNLTIGSQNPSDFNLIDWANGPYFIKIVVDGVEFGTSQLLSVPYALHAKTAESVNETDPLFAGSLAASITQTQIENWTNKLSEFAETDPDFNASVAATISQTQIETWTNKLDEYLETDPEFAASLAHGITATDTAYWNSKLDEFVESDPTFLAHPASGITEQDITMWKALWIWYTTNSNGYLTSEVDGSVTNELQTLSRSNDTIFLENGGSVKILASGITGADTANWNKKLDTETDPTVLQGTQAGQMQYWSGTAWIALAPGNDGQVLTFTGGMPAWKPQVEEGDVKNPKTGKIWMDRNLGASQVATSSTDVDAYGDLYQWGRGADGHQLRNSGTNSVLSSSDTPGHSDFITNTSHPGDWRSPKNDNLWQGINGTNNPCPSGYRLPTKAEWEEERLSWSSNDAAGAYASPLKLPLAGTRDSSYGPLYDLGLRGRYWTGSVDGSYSPYLIFSSSDAITTYSNYRAFGYSIRCIKD